MSTESRPLESRLPPPVLRGWPVLSTLGALPILLPFWVFNGVLSVEGLPTLWTLLMGSTPLIMLRLFPYIGWSTVIFSTLIEVRVFYRALKGRSRGKSLGSTAFFFASYDLATTGLGLYSRLEPQSILRWTIWGLGVLVVTFIVEATLSMIWRDSKL